MGTLGGDGQIIKILHQFVILPERKDDGGLATCRVCHELGMEFVCQVQRLHLQCMPHYFNMPLSAIHLSVTQREALRRL